MLTKRIIPCLDVRNGQVVKGVRFRDHQIVGDILELAAHYCEQQADELVFYDITASSEQRSVEVAWVKKVAQNLDIPFCVAGGIRDLNTAEKILNAGADKISINTPALENPDFINDMVRVFGSQCVVIGIDSQQIEDRFYVYQYTGKESTMRSSERFTDDWIKEVTDRGAGEIVLNCMNQDGRRRGYDIFQLTKMRSLTALPLIASGGAGNEAHFAAVFQEANVDGALAASVFHSGAIAISELKAYLARQNVPVRL